MLILFNVLPFVGWAVGLMALLWPFLGVWAVLVASPVLGYLVYAWFHADKVVASQAEFRPPTGLQARYFDFLGIREDIWTHPSLCVAAGVLCGPKRRTLLMTAGLTRYLTDEEIKNVVKGLTARPHGRVFRWTFHLATGGAMLFSSTSKREFSSDWFRIMFVSSAVIASLTVAMLSIYVNALNGALPIWMAVAALLIPFSALVVWVGWSTGAMILSRRGAQKWNRTVWVSSHRLQPMARPVSGYHRIHLLYPGLVEGLDIPEHRE